MANGIALGGSGGRLINPIDRRRLVVDVNPRRILDKIEQNRKRTKGEAEKLRPIERRADRGGQDTAREGRSQIQPSNRALESTNAATPKLESRKTSDALRQTGGINAATNRVENRATDPDIRANKPDLDRILRKADDNAGTIKRKARNHPDPREIEK